ncbi:GNAT family N-acetyltransferase [Pseudoalteromonas sp. MMG012]|uniref:GNAT family N-acetyltransferase n=1 Tax=Pseudoalteromonas sp. MMG012 TaxID=2822686 RepID=UPI001B3A6BDB|nr:GNAT family N-acetyltransferase [Pseudoalteromonas sp. MMG012]MBQ4850797.1 GNAT family N-acetyltransferase [Pseudoalteromonas sp. MMG012]
MYVVKQLTPMSVPLINKFYQQFSVRGRATKQDQCWVVKSTEIIAGCLIQSKDDALLLSTVFVHPEYRSQGFAKSLLTSVLQSQNEVLYTFSYRKLDGFYRQLGFEYSPNLPHHLSVSFSNYIRQKRDIVAMCIYK